jgi:4-hydroxy-tetrahydrodipicolinate synthase
MSSQAINGLIGACLTPFDEDGRVDYAALRHEIDFIVSDADAISIGAVEAAEYTMLSPDERKQLLRVGTEMVDGRIPVILGASSPTLHGGAELADHAAEVGADLIQVLMPLRPWGGQPKAAELIDYFAGVAYASPLPIVAYHNPGPGADPPIDAFVELSEMDEIQYFKESSRNITKIARLVEEIDLAGKANYFTTMQPLLTTLIMGGSGATMPPPGTRIGAEVVRAVRAGNLERARQWQRFFSLFPATWGSYGLAPIMKSAMKHFGVDLGDPAPPYRPVTIRDHDQIGSFFRQIGLLDGTEVQEDALGKLVTEFRREQKRSS